MKWKLFSWFMKTFRKKEWIEFWDEYEKAEEKRDWFYEAYGVSKPIQEYMK